MGMGMGNVRTRKWDCHGIRRPRHRSPKGGAPPEGIRFGTTERKRRGKEHCHLGENSRVHDRVLKRDQRGSGKRGGTRYTLTSATMRQRNKHSKATTATRLRSSAIKGIRN